MEYISTTSLSNELDIPTNELFSKLKSLAWIDRKNDKWVLTELGKQKGGQTRTNPKFGEYIVWPDNISLDNDQQAKDKPKLLNATTIGKHYNISSQRLNLVLSELGWIEKDLAGWTITKLGKSVGGKQYEHETSGGTYVLWPGHILENKSLNEVFKESQPEKETTKVAPVPTQQQAVSQPTSNNFRDKFPATIRTRDGHMVRSRAEVIIDNALYEYKLAHAYERKLPIEEDLYSDFYIPSENVYIEFWGMENDPKYLERKKVKLEIYKKYDFKLIEITDEDILNLDDHLPKKLLKFGIKVY
ncbi:MAG: glycerol kinase [Sphingobacteriales bacterium]|nr:glycerol kinase [Sphingobacteriales bacterium]